MNKFEHTPPIHVLIADDHSLIIEGFKSLLQASLKKAVFYTAKSSSEATSIVRKHTIDIVLLDAILDDGISFSIVEILKRVNPSIKILVMSAMPEDTMGQRALDAGADGFVSKKQEDHEIINAVKAVLDGRKYLSESLMYKMVFNREFCVGNPFQKLTSREFEVVMHILQGKSITETAFLMNVQRTTISTHKVKILEKLNIQSLLQLQQLAIEHNIVAH